MSLFGRPRLTQVHPNLVALFEAVSHLTDIQVVQGARTLAEEEGDIATHHSTLHDPHDSKHVVDATRTLARAVDVAPWPVHWSDLPRFVSLATLVLSTASQLGIPVTWGGHWTHLADYDHWEIPDGHV